MQIRRYLLSLFLALGLGISLAPAPSFAQSDPRGLDNPDFTSYGVRCSGGVCSLAVDLGPVEAEAPVDAAAPIKFDLPVGNLGFLSGGAVEISDQLTLKLPVGQVKITDGDFNVRLDEAGQIVQLHGATQSMQPNLTLPNGMHFGGDFAAEFGYDFGSELGAFSDLVDPDGRYLFLRVGDGFNFDTALPNENGRAESITVAVPNGESATLVIDPTNQVLYLDGRFDMSQVLRLITVATMLGIDVGQLPALSGLTIPLNSTVGIAAMISRDASRNFIETNGKLSIEGGPIGKLLKIDKEPLALDSSLRIDPTGIKLQGVAGAALAPKTLLDGGGSLEVFIPFQRFSDAYVRIGGDISVPIVGIAAEGITTLGGSTRPGEPGVAGDDGPGWWDAAGAWIGGTASGTAQGVASGSQSALDALQGAVDAARQGLGAAKDKTVGGADAAAGAAGNAAGAVKDVAAGAAGATAGAAGSAAEVVKDVAGAAADAAGNAAGAVKDAAGTAAGAAGNVAGAAGSGVAGAAGAAAGAAGNALSGATSGINCGVLRAQQLWCTRTGLCEPPTDVCVEPAPTPEPSN
ncbi:MAG: hypothetical protein IPK16_31410 [Anaerolineales bacterium]|nr:hypothetical protein [Anaerolineales bacterium]